MLGSIKPSKTHCVFHKMPEPNQESEWSCIYVSCIDAVSVSTSFLLDLGTVLIVCYSYVFHLLDLGTVLIVCYCFVFHQ